MKKLMMWCASLWMVGAMSLAHAELQAPDALIKNTAQEVLAIVKQDKDMQAGSQKKVLEMVDAKVLPHFNFTRMTKLAVGKHWRTATAQQKQALEAEFRNMLVRTYTKAFTVYRDQEVEIRPLKVADNATEVTVKTMIVKPGTPSIPVNYDMEKTPEGWKVFDLVVEGVSLVTSYRSTFSDQIQKGGIDGLIKTLVEKNSAGADVGKKATAK